MNDKKSHLPANSDINKKAGDKLNQQQEEYDTEVKTIYKRKVRYAIRNVMSSCEIASKATREWYRNRKAGSVIKNKLLESFNY